MSEWQTFAELLGEESRLLGELGAAALGLTDALVANDPEAIEKASGGSRRSGSCTAPPTPSASRCSGAASAALTLPQVCAYAPPVAAPPLQGAVHANRYRARSRCS